MGREVAAVLAEAVCGLQHSAIPRPNKLEQDMDSRIIFFRRMGNGMAVDK
jgi:hypothetical protein